MTPARVSEAVPVQVYLDRSTRDRLDRLVEHMGSNKSDILRRGLLALERELSDPAAHPALRLAGAVAHTTTTGDLDAALDHDALLAAVHEPASPPYGKRKLGKRNG